MSEVKQAYKEAQQRYSEALEAQQSEYASVIAMCEAHKISPYQYEDFAEEYLSQISTALYIKYNIEKLQADYIKAGDNLLMWTCNRVSNKFPTHRAHLIDVTDYALKTTGGDVREKLIGLALRLVA